MLKSIVTLLTLTLLGGLATADDKGKRRDRREQAKQRHFDKHHRDDQPRRVNRPGRANRKIINRRPVYVSNGNYVFASGTTRVYTRPVIRTRYYNARVRPQFVVENYTAEPGYIWVRGQWSWGGREWIWNDGHYAPDPQFQTYYDDGSYDYSVNISIGN